MNNKRKLDDFDEDVENEDEDLTDFLSPDTLIGKYGDDRVYSTNWHSRMIQFIEYRQTVVRMCVLIEQIFVHLLIQNRTWLIKTLLNSNVCSFLKWWNCSRLDNLAESFYPNFNSSNLFIEQQQTSNTPS